MDEDDCTGKYFIADLERELCALLYGMPTSVSQSVHVGDRLSTSFSALQWQIWCEFDYVRLSIVTVPSQQLCNKCVLSTESSEIALIFFFMFLNNNSRNIKLSIYKTIILSAVI
mgnify:CR=1 FL=1